MIIYTDASYRLIREKKEKIKTGKICFILDNQKPVIKILQLKEIKGLKQYNNIFELWAVLEALKATKAKRIEVFTDSQVVYFWLRRGGSLDNSWKHKQLKDDIEEIKRKLSFSIQWIPREQNKAGIFLEKEEN